MGLISTRLIAGTKNEEWGSVLLIASTLEDGTDAGSFFVALGFDATLQGSLKLLDSVLFKAGV